MPDDDFVDDEPQLDDEVLDEDQDIEDEVEDLLDEPDDQDDESEPEARQQQQRRKPVSERIRDLGAREKQALERAERAEQELQRFRAGPTKTTQELQAERQRHLDSLTTEGRLEFLINETRHQTQAELNQIRFASFDASDQGSFEALCARNPTVAAVRDQVETELKAMRANGQNATRAIVARYVIGDRALNKQSRAKTAGAKRAAEGRDRQGARPINGRGDAPPNRGRSTNEREARAKRLDGVKL